ncbi:MAG: hypothetical protein DBX52_05555 [Clostridiales bacterium]|nr:MAG: hypothetical protein DBX52_05555 [Clostridiales bacterium]
MILKADLHTHTNASPDGRSSLAALCAAAQKKGIGALAVCDHNRFTAVPESLCGVLLIPGCEFSTQAGHITGLFLERQPDFARLFARGLPGGAETVAEIRRCGGLAILAHPFQNPRRSVNDFLFPLDGVETRNARAGLKNKPANLQAEMFAQEKGLPSIGASDAHAAQEIGNAYTEIECSAPVLPALRAALAAGRGRPILQKNTSHTSKGLSQFCAARRAGGLKKFCRGFCYLGYCILLDLFRR